MINAVQVRQGRKHFKNPWTFFVMFGGFLGLAHFFTNYKENYYRKSEQAKVGLLC